MELISRIRYAVRDLVDTDECLLQSLREAIYVGTEKGSGKSSFGSKLLISVGAWDLYHEIEKEWKQPTLTLEDSFLELPKRALAVEDPRILRQLLKSLESIAKAIRDLLDPPRRLHVSAACPVCDVRTVFRPDNSGELVQQAALSVDGVKGCVCLACGSIWAVNNLETLAVDLGCASLP